MKTHRQSLATIGLIFITFLAAIQYVFLQNVPETVSSFSFVFITNVIGILVLGLARFKKLLHIPKKTLLKGILFAVELLGFNLFTLLGSRNMDAVIISSVISLYFVFVTPLLLLFKRRVNFFSGIATIIAIIALLLMFGADVSTLFSSVDVFYLIIADVCFAAYVVSVAILGEKEDSVQLSISQMVFSGSFAFIGWLIECALGKSTLSIPMDMSFWVSALFIGIAIRAIYGLLQITCQKYVSALKTSLIFSAEIIITMIADPFMCMMFDKEYTPVTGFQIVGAVLLIIATLMVDDTIMSKIGYKDLQEKEIVDEKGTKIKRSSVSKKMIFNTLTFTMITLVVTSVICLVAIGFIKGTAVESSAELGENASNTSKMAMINQLEDSISTQAKDKSLMAEEKLMLYSDAVTEMSSFAHSLYERKGEYPSREVPEPKVENDGKWVMQRTLANEDVNYSELQDESILLGNMQDIFVPIVKNNENISTIYMGTEDGLMVSYDTGSKSAVEMGYYEFRESGWYNLGKESKKAQFTDTYQDGYGRGLTITCVAPFTDGEGNFKGCVAMDILMKELNESMVNDGIVPPSVGVLIDKEGKLIAGKDVDPNAEEPGTIFDEGRDTALASAGKGILEYRNGITSNGVGDSAVYIAYASIDTTGWILCITSPVTLVQKPAERINETISENTEKVVGSVQEGVQRVVQSCLVLIALILLIVTLVTGKISRRISDPLKKLEEDVKNISGGNLELRTEVKTNDEIGSLAESFNYMTDSLQKYITDLKDVTAKEERIASELALATNIQASMVPTNFDAYADQKSFDLHASMTPAKEVGGDFYDFFMTDEEKIALVMADVSGKGVPAALFMAKAMTAIKTRTMMGGTPADILGDVNDQMCEGNEAELFVTVWLAVIDLKTGKGMAANAGHEHPALRHKDGSFELIKYRHSPAVATMEGLPFKEHEFELVPGDTLYVYTDGVTEATDANNELFGEERLTDVLNKNPDADPKELIDNVIGGINEFVADAPQFDDLTMMAFRYYGDK